MRLTRSRPSPATILAVMALSFALAGTAIAAPDAALVDLSKRQVKKIAKKQANKVLNKRAPKLSVHSAGTANLANRANFADEASLANNANNADTVDGFDANALRTSSSYVEDAGANVALTPTFATVLTTQVDTHGTRVMASGTVEGQADGGDNDSVQCRIEIDGAAGSAANMAHDIPTSFNNQSILTVGFAREVGPGTHTVNLQCRELAGTVTAEDATLMVWAVGS